MHKHLLSRLSFLLMLLPSLTYGLEKPTFEVLEKWEDVEIRLYPAQVVARTQVDASFEKAGSEGFKRLGGYIFGSNHTEQKISMTAPVSQTLVDDDTYWVTFFMPAAYDLADLPKPIDTKVILELMPPQTLAVIHYKGGWSEKKYRENEKMLRAFLNASPHWSIIGEPRWARYNPPFMPSFFRTNEVMIPVESTNTALSGKP
ncbi:MAG: hypothetical protein ACI9FB_001230 [Candidatus Azotimanducaceae bacterium]|jgi:hypothetical protein